MKYNYVALFIGYNQVFFHPEVLDFLPIYFPHIVSISGKSHLFSWERLDSKKFNLCMYILRTEKQGRSKLMFMPFDTVSIIMCMALWYFFRNMTYCSLFTFTQIAHVRASCH